MLDFCIQPTCKSSEEFFRDYWLKKPLHARGGRGRYESRFRLADLEFLWATTMKVDPSSMMFFSHGAPVTVLRSAFFAFCHQISVVVNKADKLSPSILHICKDFEKHFPFVFCNVYSTPAGEQTVPIHTDDRDVFVLQVHGAKQWTVFDDPPVVLPYKAEEIGKTTPTPDASKLKVCFEGLVENGDLLYLPRGFAHVAKALPHSPSIHLTIAVQTSDWDVNALVHDGVTGVLERLLVQGAAKGPRQAPDLFKLREVLPPSVMSSVADNNDDDNDDDDDDDEGGEEGENGAAAAAAAKNNNKSMIKNEKREKALQDFRLETDYIDKLKQSLDLVFESLKAQPEVCVDRFRQRLVTKRETRQEFYNDNVAPLRFLPLSPVSLLQWNGDVFMVQVSDVADPSKRIGSVQHCVIMKKKLRRPTPTVVEKGNGIGDGGGRGGADDEDVIQLHVSSPVLEIIKAWQEHFVVCPGQLSEMFSFMEAHVVKNFIDMQKKQNNSNSKVVMPPQPDVTLACLCVAGFLLRNGCMIRIS